ncbi:serine protease [Streptomonospora sp. S1-112]|uniref:Serine protease n=1 Tax=Streptomonospora mangrovi TaxID=2883123 RepID=A0A9X3NMH7_9ACTN|nr:serine protease [Streptomonospora mangrovi]MDA0564781.1 serine protease [Streptomonospora mangrovi]
MSTVNDVRSPNHGPGDENAHPAGGAPTRQRRGVRALGGAVLAALALGALAGAGSAHADEPEPSAGPTPMIIGGTPADQPYPFAASLQYERNGVPDSHRCTGALVEEEWVVTAAHCVTALSDSGEPFEVLDPGMFHLRLGSNDRTEGGHVVAVADIAVHPDYRYLADEGSGSDIALLRLAEEAPVEPIRLDRRMPRPGTEVRQIGWGYTSTDASDPSQLPESLRQLDTVTLPGSARECRVDEEGDAAWGIRPGDICTDNPDGVRGPCGGDSGSPLLTRVRGEWRVAGVDSRGVGSVCGTTPDIYTSVAAHDAWMDRVMG